MRFTGTLYTSALRHVCADMVHLLYACVHVSLGFTVHGLSGSVKDKITRQPDSPAVKAIGVGFIFSLMGP